MTHELENYNIDVCDVSYTGKEDNEMEKVHLG